MKVSKKLFPWVLGTTLLATSLSAFAIDGAKLRLGTGDDFFQTNQETGKIDSLTTAELYLDIENFESLTQDEQEEKIGIVLKNLKLQYFSVKGDEDNHLRYSMPLTGFEFNRLGDDEMGNNILSVNMLGVGGKKTLFVKKTEDGYLKLSIEGDVYGQYVLGSNTMNVECPDCITDVLTHSEEYHDPTSLDWGLQTKVKLSLDINDKIIISAYNETYSGSGGGTFGWAHYQNPNTPFEDTSTHLEVDVDNSYDYRETGLNLEYKKNKRLSFFLNLSQSETKWTKTISEQDLDHDMTTSTSETITNPDGSTDVVTVEHTEHVYKPGHKETWEEETEDVNVMFGVSWKFWGPK